MIFSSISLLHETFIVRRNNISLNFHSKDTKNLDSKNTKYEKYN